MYAPVATFTTPEQLDQLPLGTIVLSGGKHPEHPAVFVPSLPVPWRSFQVRVKGAGAFQEFVSRHR